MPDAAYVLIGMAIMGLPCLLLLWLLQRGARGARSLAETEGRLSESLRSAHAELAARLERSQAGLRSGLEDRLRQDLAGLEARTTRQLEAVRADVAAQFQRLGDRIDDNLPLAEEPRLEPAVQRPPARVEESGGGTWPARPAAGEPPGPVVGPPTAS